MKNKKSLIFALFLLVLLIVAFLPFNPEPLTKEQITSTTYRVFEYSGIYAPHNLLFKPDDFEKHKALFDDVEAGKELNAEQSKTYRMVYQSLLVENQFIFKMLDSNINILTDVNMDIENNVGDKGIANKNDHHDASVRSNLTDMLNSMKVLSENNGTYSNIKNAKSFYKNTMDIMLHLGTIPQVKSTKHQVKEGSADNKVDQLIELSLVHFKQAQFENINSQAYWREVRLALDSYVKVVLIVQNIVQKKLSPIERTLTGTWDSWKNLAPIIDSDLKVRVAWLSGS